MFSLFIKWFQKLVESRVFLSDSLNSTHKLLFSRFSIRILSREEVQETERLFPVSSHKELNSAIKLFKETNYSENTAVIHYCLPIKDGKINVLFWSFEQGIANSHMICIPELLIRALPHKDEILIQVEEPNCNYFIYKNKHVLRTLVNKVQDWKKNQVLFSLGAGSNCKDVIDSQPLTITDIKQSLSNFKISNWLGFYSNANSKNEKESIDPKFVSKLVISTIGIWVIFAIVTSFFLKSIQSSTEEKLAESRQQIGSVKSQYESVTENITKLNQQVKELNNYTDINKTLSVISQIIYQENASFVRFSLRANVSTVILEANSATKVLNAMKAHQFISDANFSNDVRNTRGGKEQFGITFNIKSGNN